MLGWVYLTVFGSLVAYRAYTVHVPVGERPAGGGHQLRYVNPAIAVAMGVGMGGEYAGPEIFIAVALIVAATVMVMRKSAPGLLHPQVSESKRSGRPRMVQAVDVRGKVLRSWSTRDERYVETG